MMFTARQNGQSNCLACAKARPQLGTVAFRLTDEKDPAGLQCILQLFRTSYTPLRQQCKTLSLLFPQVKRTDVPPSVTMYQGNYNYFLRTGGGYNIRTLPHTYCSHTIDITENNGSYAATWFIDHTAMRADLWWLCGDMGLRPQLPANWQGSFTLTQLLIPLHLFPKSDF